MKGMSARTLGLIGWSMCAFSLALTALSLLLLTLNALEPSEHVFEHWIENTVFALGFSTIGALLLPRSHPQNPMGWFFCVVGLLFAAVHFVAEYAIYALLAAPGSLPAGEAAAWICSWLYAPNSALVHYWFCCSRTVGCRVLAGGGSYGSVRSRSRCRWSRRRSLRGKSISAWARSAPP
jgi:hypothetical protein